MGLNTKTQIENAISSNNKLCEIGEFVELLATNSSLTIDQSIQVIEHASGIYGFNIVSPIDLWQNYINN